VRTPRRGLVKVGRDTESGRGVTSGGIFDKGVVSPPFLSPLFPLLFLSPFFLSPLLSSSPVPFLPLRSRPPTAARESGGALKLPQRVRAEPAAKRFSVNCRVKIYIMSMHNIEQTKIAPVVAVVLRRFTRHTST